MLISLEDPALPTISFPSWADQSIVLRCCKYEINNGQVVGIDSTYDRLQPGVVDLSWHHHTLQIWVIQAEPFTVVRLCNPFQALIQVKVLGYNPTDVPHPPREESFDLDRQSVWRRLDQEPWVRPPVKSISQNPAVQRTIGRIRKFFPRLLKLR